MIAVVGFKICTKPDANTLNPGPFPCSGEVEIMAWFEKAKAGGFTFESLPNDEARMSKTKIADRVVWVETHDGNRVSLLKWI